MIHARYDPALVLASVAVACIAAYAALSLSARMLASPHPARASRWLLGSSVVMGSGIWAMHFVAMLAYIVGVQVSYHLDLTALSMLFAVVGTALAFWWFAQRQSALALAIAGLFMGAAIVSMHYTGMAAFVGPFRQSYSIPIVLLSALIAVGASMVALWTAFRSFNDLGLRVVASLLLGGAVSGMHYTGMAALSLGPGGGHERGLLALDTDLLATVTVLAVVALAAVSSVAARSDQKLARAAAANRLLAAAVEERRRQDQVREMAARELSHRMKNILTVVQAIAASTGRTAENVPQFLERFNGRLTALAGAADVLRDAGGEHSELASLVRSATSPFDSSRFSVSGPKFEVPANLGWVLSLILHELATNATKYGSLSTPAGRVQVTWGVDDHQVSLTWSELGGPRLQSPPEQEGFGSELIRRLVAMQAGGQLEMQFEDSGLVCRFALPREGWRK